MQRDLGNEVIVAIAAVGILAFAITFAIILSLSNTPAATVTATVPSNTGGVTQVVTAVSEVSTTVAPTEDTIATLTSIAATVQQAQTVIPTHAVTVQQAQTTIPTQSLVIQETVAPVQTNVATEAVVVTPVQTQPATQTVVTQPTVAIPTKEPDTTRNSTNAPTVVNTAQVQSKPSATPTPRKPTPTSSFTPTATDSATPTPIPPTNTPTRTPSKTPTPTPTLTRTPRPTETSGIRPTPTLLLTAAVMIPTVSPNGGCVPPQGWVVYVVRHGDTLFKIARAVGSSLFELQTANCLTDINNIITGMPIYVPRLPTTAINPTPATGDPVVTSSLQPEGCTDPNSVITNLQPGQIISGVFNVMGTANLPDFWYYKLEVRPDSASIYNFYSRSELAIVDGSLGQIDQSIFGSGIHWIKLTVIGKTNGATPCAIPVIFQ